MAQHQLPEPFRQLIDEHYVPILAWLRDRCPKLLGINGAQGTGKSTLADFLRLALESDAGWCVAVLSIDDFYLTKTEREHLGEVVHPLLRTRGVPGTHDLPMLTACLEQLGTLGPGMKLPIPRFDKARDDRASPETWPVVTGPLELIILEGWCVGSPPQADAELATPVNALEAERDASGHWRHYVNEHLKVGYRKLFAGLDKLIVLQAPNFDAVYRWRLEQEQKGAGVMDAAQIAEFIQHYERLTRANLKSLPDIADVVLEFDDHHDCIKSRFR